MIESVAHSNLAYPLWRLWRIDEALAHHKASIAMQESMGLTYGAAALINYAYLLGSVGDYRESMRMFDRAESAARRSGRPNTRPLQPSTARTCCGNKAKSKRCAAPSSARPRSIATSRRPASRARLP